MGHFLIFPQNPLKGQLFCGTFLCRQPQFFASEWLLLQDDTLELELFSLAHLMMP